MSAPVEVVVTGLGLVAPGVAEPSAVAAVRVRPFDDWFDGRAMLGPRGYKYLPEACQYLLAAGRRALADAGEEPVAAAPSRCGAVVGTNNAASPLHDAMDRIVLDGRPEHLSPALAPFFSVNVFAGRLSIEHALRAVSLTVNSPGTGGLEAVQVATRMLRLGRADLLLAGATEAAVAAGDPGVGAAEAGSAVLVLQDRAAAEARGRPVYGTVTVRVAHLTAALAQGRAAQVLDDLLGAAGAAGADSYHSCIDDSPTARAVTTAVRRCAGGVDVRAEELGAGCLTPVVRLVRTLAGPPGRHVVVTASAEGNVGVAVVTT